MSGYNYHSDDPISVSPMMTDFDLSWDLTVSSLSSPLGSSIGLTLFNKYGNTATVAGIQLGGVHREGSGRGGFTVAVAFLLMSGEVDNVGPFASASLSIGPLNCHLIDNQLVETLFDEGEEVRGGGEFAKARSEVSKLEPNEKNARVRSAKRERK